MKQIPRIICTIILGTLVTACSVATPAINNSQTIAPIHIATATSSPVPVSPTVSMPTPIPTATAYSVQLETIGTRGTPQFLPDGERLILPTSLGVFALDASSYQNGTLLVPFTSQHSYPHVTISSDAKLIAWNTQLMAVNNDHDLPDLQIPWSIRGTDYQSTFSDSRFSPDNTLLAVFYGDTQLDVWDLVNGKFLYTIPAALSMDFSPDGRLIAAVTIADNVWRIQLHEARTGTLIKDWPGQRAVFLPDNRLALENNAAIRIYDLSTDKVSNFFNGRFPAFSPDGALIALLYYDQVEIHRLSDGKLLHRLQGNFADVDRFELRFAPQ
jgi:WD40 repeat protein